ncbi:MAG: hypothetical protein JWP43_138 [Ramlibacter sp.]|nr:hypothetical protein [Ramlibacter sp.]
MRKQISRSSLLRTLPACMVVVAGLAGCGGGSGGDAAPATGITKIEVNSQASAFGGTAFGAVGTYEKIVGTAFGQLDPNDPKNQVITDITLAKKDPATGMVPYSFDFYILKPTNLANGAHKVFYEGLNRGAKQFASFNSSGGGNTVGAAAADATVAGAAYPGFLMNNGYTLVWSGWDAEPMTGGSNVMRANLPIAVNPDGSPITGPSYEYLVADNATTTCQTTYYSPAPNTSATLTARKSMTDTPVVVPAAGWSWGGANSCGNTSAISPPGTNSISLNGAAFQPGWIYELTYTAMNPYVAGVGMAAMRDFVSFLKNAKADTAGTANPVAGDVKSVASWNLSQPGRLMNDFVWLGFNQDLGGKKVFDGVFNWINGGDGLGINYRFAQVGRTERNRQHHIGQLEGVFPFSYTTTVDPLTGKTDGRDVRCTATGTCPNVMNVFSGNEMWVKAGSLLTIDPATGKDLPDVPNVRNYYIASAQHGNASSTTSAPTTCTQFGSQVDPNPVMRALWVALDNWISNGAAPPASAVASVAAGTAIPVPLNGPNQDLGIGAVTAAAIGYPDIPSSINQFSGLVTVRNFWNFGPRFNQGILDNIPGIPTGKYYANYVPKVDANGNDIPGIRTPDVTAPLGSSSGWALRSTNFGGSTNGTDGCESAGQFVPFALNDASKVPGDPRPSLTTLYTDKNGFVAARTAAAQAMLAQGLLLPNDAAKYATNAAGTFTVVPNPNYPQAYNYKW